MATRYPMQSLQDQMGQMSMAPTTRAGESPLLALFSEGNVIVLRSQASGTNIRIYDGEVQGSNEDGPSAHFIVHVRRPGVVALQNEKAPNNWLGVYEGRTVGTGGGGPFCEVMVGEVEDKFVTFESITYPGQRIGFFPDGQVKPATDVTNQDDGRFIPHVHFFAASSAVPQTSMAPGQYPPPQMAPQVSMAPGQYPPPQGAPQTSMAPGQYPPPQGPPQTSLAPGQYPGQYPPPQGGPPPSMAPGQYPPPQGGPPPSMAPGQYPPPQGSPQTMHHGQYPMAPGQYPPSQAYPQHPPSYGPPPPQGSTGPSAPSSLPYGFTVTDAFREGNVVCLVSRSSGNPCNFFKGEVACCGRFSHPDSLWVVSSGPNQTISLTNSSWPGFHIAIRSSGKVLTGKGKKDKYTYLHVRVHPDNYVYFESAENAGCYVGFNGRGFPCRPKEVAASDDNAKFFVRVERQRHPPSNQILTMYGWPSVFSTLLGQSVIQLYIKGPTVQYLCINKAGNVSTTNNGNDDHTFFVWMDRGMGIVSLQSRKNAGYRIRMTNFVLVGKGDCDFNADFRVKENSDRTISFESVTCPGGILRAQMGQTTVERFSVFLLTIQKFGRSETITKAPIN